MEAFELDFDASPRESARGAAGFRDVAALPAVPRLAVIVATTARPRGRGCGRTAAGTFWLGAMFDPTAESRWVTE